MFLQGQALWYVIKLQGLSPKHIHIKATLNEIGSFSHSLSLYIIIIYKIYILLRNRGNTEGIGGSRERERYDISIVRYI